jgi:hypothetical protein
MPRGLQEVEAPRFQDNRQMKVVVSPSHRPEHLTDGAVTSSRRLPKASGCATIGKEQTVNNVKDRG